jgi:AraC-like DNA-binding protein
MDPTPRSDSDERHARWHDGLAATFGGLVPEPLGADRPDGGLAGTRLGELAAFHIHGSPQIVRRSPRSVRAEPIDLYKICVPLTGRATVRQDDREIIAEPGQLVVYDTGRPYRLRLESQWTCAVLAFPRTALGLSDSATAAALGHAHPLTDGPGAVLAGFVDTALAQRNALPAAAADRIGAAGLHLIAGTLGQAAEPSTADALRLQVLGYVRTHLADPDLCHATVAAAHHMAPRSLHRLFEHEPHTVTDHIRTLRLAAIHRDLTDPRLRRHPIAAIAARWNFPDQAHLTRAFRAQFGHTPSQARRTAR